MLKTATGALRLVAVNDLDETMSKGSKNTVHLGLYLAVSVYVVVPPAYQIHLRMTDLDLSSKLSHLADCLREPRDISSPQPLLSMSTLAVKRSNVQKGKHLALEVID